jgi:outer membrane protein OmpA-like peptidoglycan-associated protein
MALPLALVVGVGTTGCATKGFVRTSVGEVNDKVDSLGRSVEETQERQRQAEGRITQVETATKQAAQSAQQANSAAADAASAARAADTRAAEIEKANARLVYEVVLSDDQGNFAFGDAELPDTAKARLDELISQMQADPQAAWFEIEGHTDNVGPDTINLRLGLERAEAVKRYLYEQHKIPLHKINVISYGSEKPVAPNNTRDGRAQNRRVVIKVVA